ncbi:hypothetical protein [Micromonospora carbonacea]|uniref:Uncharacterized protein n=1 Tax=Micromonospora carbonacea TaxID=47853 RepID=A0A1C5A9E2_9ACTN|nr:hypothetical protein [Micromonospora carbonacea]SCF41837.1 hypothetical protein GA0070563_1125 [Micromonospora carbonacea]
MTTDDTTCTIVTEFLGINLGPCGRDATHTSTGHCENGHTRTRAICTLHAAGFQSNPTAIVCEWCVGEGRDTQMVVQIAEVDA